MAERVANAHELIRRLIDGEDRRAKGLLVQMGGEAVSPLLDAIVGDHGRLGDSLPELVDTLKRIAKKDVEAVLPALKDHSALNLVVWAVGHGAVQDGNVNAKAHRALKRHRKHEDTCIGCVVDHHLEKIEKTTKRGGLTEGRARKAVKAVKAAAKGRAAKKGSKKVRPRKK